MILLLLKQGMEEGKKGNRVIETVTARCIVLKKIKTVTAASKNEFI